MSIVVAKNKSWWLMDTYGSIYNWNDISEISLKIIKLGVGETCGSIQMKLDWLCADNYLSDGYMPDLSPFIFEKSS